MGVTDTKLGHKWPTRSHTQDGAIESAAGSL